jgi:hypothetical protein
VRRSAWYVLVVENATTYGTADVVLVATDDTNGAGTGIGGAMRGFEHALRHREGLTRPPAWASSALAFSRGVRRRESLAESERAALALPRCWAT